MVLHIHTLVVIVVTTTLHDHELCDPAALSSHQIKDHRSRARLDVEVSSKE